MPKVLRKIAFDARQMNEVLGLLVAFVEARKNSKDLRRALCPQNGISAGKTGHVEARLFAAAQPSVLGQQFQLNLLRYIDAGILKQGHDIICGMAEDTVLKVKKSDTGDSLAIVEPEEIG